MIHVSGWLTEERPRSGLEDNTRYILPISSGYHNIKPLDGADYALERPGGRLDYQIIYMQSGEGQFEVGQTSFRVTAGQVVVIRPHERHAYRYFHDKETSVYWLHCTGYAMGEIIAACALPTPPVLTVGQSRHLKELFRSVMLELQRKDAEYIGIASSLVLQLLYYILRKRTTLTEVPQHLRDERVDRSIMIMYERYSEPWTAETLAAQVNLSPSRFIHLFTQMHRVSPIRFLNALRVSKAKEFLGNDGMSVGDVSRMTGFQNPQYFCRLFHKETGLTPTEYRRTLE